MSASRFPRAETRPSLARPAVKLALVVAIGSAAVVLGHFVFTEVPVAIGAAAGMLISAVARA